MGYVAAAAVGVIAMAADGKAETFGGIFAAIAVLPRLPSGALAGVATGTIANPHSRGMPGVERPHR